MDLPETVNTPSRINPNLLDLVRTSALPSLFYHNRPLTTPAGKPVADPNFRFLDHMMREISLKRSLELGAVNAYTLFTVQKDLLEDKPDEFLKIFGPAFRLDPLVNRLSGPPREANSENVGSLLDFLDRHNQAFTFVFGGLSNILASVNQFLLKTAPGPSEVLAAPPAARETLFKETYAGLSREKKSAVLVLHHTHQSGVLLPLLLVLNHLSPSEYAHGLFLIHLPYLTAENQARPPESPTESSLTWVCFRPDWNTPEESYDLLRAQAASILEYLAYFEGGSNRRLTIQDLIHNGEDFNLEFKSTLRWNIKAARKDPAIEHASLKTITAFLNSGGGRLLIGVRDDGSIEGLETDGFENTDKFAQHFWNLVKSSLGVDVTSFVHTDFETIDGRTVFLVECAKSHRPVFLKQKGFDEEFYIRVGPSSARLGIQDALKYIGQRFPK